MGEKERENDPEETPEEEETTEDPDAPEVETKGAERDPLSGY